MNIDQETTKKIQELQILEQNLQSFLVQKQAVQIELNEITNALEELKKSDGDVYKVIGGIMIKSSKERLSKDLEEKKKLSELRVNLVEKQETLLEKKAADLREEINTSISKKKD